MIITLDGLVEYHGVGFVIVVCAGVGYKVILPEEVASGLSGEIHLYTHEVTRDDGRELFGFISIDQLELFWKLIAVSGVGPKSAQKIVCSRGIKDVRESILIGDIETLTRVPGIGKKTAQKIILELKGVLVDTQMPGGQNADAVEALIGLGYSRRDAEAALSGLTETETEARIRAALKRLSL